MKPSIPDTAILAAIRRVLREVNNDWGKIRCALYMEVLACSQFELSPTLPLFYHFFGYCSIFIPKNIAQTMPFCVDKYTYIRTSDSHSMQT